MRAFLPIVLLSLSFHLPAAMAEDFSGAWVAQLCPAKANPESGECSNFVLELLQQDGYVCGTHLFSTAGAAEMDEGAAPSIFGEIADDTATVVAASGRGAPPPRMKVELSRQGKALTWKRLDKPSGNDLLPRSATLERARGETFFAPLFAQELKAVCSLNFDTALRRQNVVPAAAAPR